MDGATTTEAPPSYEEVVGKFNGLIGGNPNATRVLEAADGLSRTDLDVLIANHDQHFPIKTDEDKVKFATGAAEGSCSVELQSAIGLSATAAATTAVQISRTFNRVQTHLATVDRMARTSFESTFIPIKGVSTTLRHFDI
ncbi:uncharacterized protein MAM_06135 [Metarhizium album ARSEF 1941]|uniref:Uncharacterized protein n=1 Tax=Metarhizium album (strain ARSEF 1941) TaxID=1081103 RepID=A0A0B2WSU8_METAS|nr:uncharacterized protein MAM_06135 [Metarhizium album ARSEF 1941]KHN96030.1 hypothetical protein MAM_06135 [Metarhizium album ARSEF 1941]